MLESRITGASILGDTVRITTSRGCPQWKFHHPRCGALLWTNFLGDSMKVATMQRDIWIMLSS